MLGCLLLLTGCQHAPPPVILPAEVSYPAIQERLLVPEDPAQIGVDSRSVEEDCHFTLERAIRFALDNSPRLRLARADWSRAIAQEEVAFAPFLPEVNFNYRFVGFASQVQPSTANLEAVAGFGPGTQDFSQAELNLQWMLYDFGRTGNRYGQAVSQQQIAALRWQRAGQTVAYDVIHNYMRVLFSRSARLIQEESLRRAEAVLRDTSNRRKGGVADRDDVLRAEVQVSEAREALVTARQLELDAMARLNMTMGRNVSLPLQVADVVERPSFQMSLPECLELAIAGRREVEIARQAVVGSVYGLEAARAEFRPKIYTKATASRVDGSGIENEDVFGAGIHFDVPLYAGGRRFGQRDSGRADVEAAVAGAQAMLDGIALEVNLAFRDIAATRQRITLAESARVQAQEYLRLIRVKYQNGNATPTDIVEAETTLTRSQQRYFGAIYDYLTALARLDYAVGRDPGESYTGGEPELPQPKADEKKE